MLDTNLIKSEFINHENESTRLYFHDIDPGFIKDTHYTNTKSGKMSITSKIQ